MLRRLMDLADCFFTAIAVVSLAILTVLVCADVAMRYGFGEPIFFTHDAVVLYLTPALFFFGFGPTYWRNEHLAVDLLIHNASMRIRAASAAISAGIGVFIFTLLLKVSWDRGYESLLKNEVIASIIPWPAWASYLIVPAGTVAMVIFCLFRLIEQSLIVVKGAPAVEDLEQ